MSKFELSGNQLQRASALAAEIEEGNREYKFKLTNITDETLQHRITQLNWRLNEGNDEAIYQIGVEDDGNPLGLSEAEMEESLMNLSKMATAVGCSLTVKQVFAGDIGLTAEVWLRRLERQLVNPIQVQVALVGDEDAGKSSLIGVLYTGALDNGRGSARMHILQHNHEVCSGQTSSVSQHNLYFSVEGNVLNEDATAAGSCRSNRLRTRSELELAEITARVVSFIDLAGHQKYLKTTLHGLVGRSPDYCLLCISAKRGLTAMTNEHIGVALALKLPLVIAITKVDAVRSEAIEALRQKLTRLLSSGSRQVLAVTTREQLMDIFADKAQTQVIPIFSVSSVTGEGLDLIRLCFFHLPTKSWTDKRSQTTVVHVMGSFHPRCAPSASLSAEASEAVGLEYDRSESPHTSDGPVSVSSQSSLQKSPLGPLSVAEELEATVFLCQLQSGTLSQLDKLFIGPITRQGRFCTVTVRSIRVNDVPVRSAIAGQCATIMVTLANDLEIDEATRTAADALSPLHTSPSLLSLLCIPDSRPTNAELHASLLATTSPSGEISSSPSLKKSPSQTRDMSEDVSIFANAKRRPAAGLVMISATEVDEFGATRQLAAPSAHWEFTAEILVLNHPSRIRVNYEPVVHIGCIKQSARLIDIKVFDAATQSFIASEDGIATGDKAMCRFRFLYHAEFISINSSTLLREGRTRGVGTVVSTN